MSDTLDKIDAINMKLIQALAVLNALIDQFADLNEGPSLLNEELGNLIGLAETLVAEGKAVLVTLPVR